MGSQTIKFIHLLVLFFALVELGIYGVGCGPHGGGGGNAYDAPLGIAVDASGNIWVTNSNSNTVTELNMTGTTIGTYTVGSEPAGIAIDSSGNVWVATAGTAAVTKLNSMGSTIGTYTVPSVTT